MEPDALNTYVQKYLKQELAAIKTSLRITELPALTDQEKAIVYKYSNDGYEGLNEQLRLSKGRKLTVFGTLLKSVLAKIQDYTGVVYRGVFLSSSEIQNYRSAHFNNSIINEYAFLSTTRSVAIANQVPGMNCMFVIYSKTGKAIEKIAKFGSHSPPNEYEVLFMDNTKFRVLNIIDHPGYLLLTLEEI